MNTEDSYSGNNLLGIIDDILDFSKIAAGKLKVEFIEFSLYEKLNEFQTMFFLKAEEKGIAFRVNNSSEVPSVIFSDPTCLCQCLINLVNNAIKFTEKGHVHINVSLDNDSRAFIRFDIEDTGIGISKDRIDAIFKSFTQVDGGPSRKYGGTGLGLSIAKELAGLLGGKLTLTSEEDKGSVFSLVMPTGIDGAGQPLLERGSVIDYIYNNTQNTQQPKFSGHVLVAEDVKTNQVLIEILLNKMGVDVTFAEDGNKALQKVLSNQYDLIFMDIQMPNMNGYEVTEALRKEGITTPIIALTANAMKGDKEKCLEAGCTDYLAKPIDQKQLLEKLRKYIPLEGQSLVEMIDIVKSQVNDLTELCSNQRTPKAQSGELDEVYISSDIINWDQLIGRLGDEALIEEIVPIFLKDCKERFDNLSNAMESEDTKAINFYGHAIKGASRNVCAERLSEIANQLESAGREDNLKSAVSIYEELKTEYEKVALVLSQKDWIQTIKNNNG